jgi:hypothetical protein
VAARHKKRTPESDVDKYTVPNLCSAQPAVDEVALPCDLFDVQTRHLIETRRFVPNLKCVVGCRSIKKKLTYNGCALLESGSFGPGV